MRNSSRQKGGVLSVVFPEKRLYIQSGDSTKYIRFTPVSQALLTLSGTALLCVLTASTTLFVMDRLSSPNDVDEAVFLKSSYERRLDELAEERDIRTREARSAQDRFKVAMDQISEQQSIILESIEDRRELSLALGLMRERLEESVRQRDQISQVNDRLVEQINDVSDDLVRKQGNGEDLTEIVATVSSALTEAAAARDVANAEKAELEQKLAELELRALVNDRRNDEMVQQLEQTVAQSFEPLEKMMEKTNIDIEGVLASVRKSYSGTGGGDVATVTVSSRSFEGDLNERFNEVMLDLDRMNLLRVATSKIPYMNPVQSAYRFTSGFGYRRDPKGAGRRMHRGLDFAAAKGTDIHATADGVVESAKYESGYGYAIRIRHDFGFETLYAHLSKILVEPGQEVSRGEHIGDMGSTGRSTGVHLHYEVHLNDRPVNPMIYLEAAKDVF